jgi:hypothetical protein
VTIPQQHDDPVGEATSKVLQALAVLTTVGESAARFAAAGAQNRAAVAERGANAERVADAARRQADQAAARAYAAQQRADRQLMDHAFDNTWLALADIHTAAVLWRTAAMYAVSGDQRAARVLRRAEQRLRQLNPGLVDAYQRYRAQGSNIAEAMRAAANETWEHQTRPASGTPTADLAPTPDTDHPGAGALDEATRVELGRLATNVDPQVLAGLERQWRSAGHTPAADAAARLANAGAPPAGTTNGPHLPGPATLDTAGGPPRTPPTGRDPAEPHAESAIAAAGPAGGQQHGDATDLDSNDQSGAPDDEHRDGQAAGRLQQGSAQPDRAGDEQRRRLGHAFRPLGTVELVFSDATAPTLGQPTTTQRKGSMR